MRPALPRPASTSCLTDECSVDLAGHALSTAVFGFVGYWAYRWDERAGVLLAEKRAQIAARREAAGAAVAES